MRSLWIFLFIFFNPLLLMGQDISLEEALVLADRLGEVEMLNEKGVAMLKSYLKKEENKARSGEKLNLGSWNTSSITFKKQILYFLIQAFNCDLYYRTGWEIYEQLLDKFKSNPMGQLEKKDRKKFLEMRNKMMAAHEGIQIELAIPDEEQKIGNDIESGIVLYGPGYIDEIVKENTIHPKRSTLGKTVTRTAKDLLNLGLIDNKVYQDLIAPIKEKPFPTEVELIREALGGIYFYDNYDERKASEVIFLESLNQKGIISQVNLRKILDSYQAYELKEKFAFIPYCNDALYFKTKDLPQYPQQAYLQIFEELKKILPDFTFSNFKFTIENIPEKKWDKNSLTQNGKISFRVGTQTYTNSFYYDLVKQKEIDKKDYRPTFRISSKFHKAINKWLADQNSDRRLYYANHQEPTNTYGEDDFGLILLTKQQYEAWDTDDGYYFLFKESHDNTFNSHTISVLIETYDSLGLFSHLSPQELQEGKERVLQQEINSYQDILICFPKTIVFFDWEMANLEDPYRELTIAFGESSRGLFQPREIKDDFGKQDLKQAKFCTYGFTFNGKRYEEKLKITSDWMDTRFLDMIREALGEQKVDGDIYYCLDDGQAAGYIFLNKPQYLYLKEQQPNLFPE